jgi:hypothetical protein
MKNTLSCQKRRKDKQPDVLPGNGLCDTFTAGGVSKDVGLGHTICFVSAYEEDELNTLVKRKEDLCREKQL